MQLTIERGTLLKALGHLQSVVERRNTIPILANVLLDARDGGLSLSATDMDIAINERVPADIGQPGAVTALAHTLYDIVRKLPEGAQVEIAITDTAGRLAVRSGRSQFALACLPSEDFPVMSGGDLPTRFTLPSGVLMQLVDRTRFAISMEETRYYLNGIYLHATEPSNDAPATLRAVATDGHRLARVALDLPDGAAGMPGVIVPRKTVSEVHKLAGETAEDVVIELSETRIRFSFDAVVLTSKLIDGTFPDYERVIPSGNDKFLVVDRQQFVQAVDRVSTIATEKSSAVKLSIRPGSLVLSATSPEAGSATEELEVSYDETPIEIGFNSRYLLDVASLIEGEEARFALADSALPAVVGDVADDTALYVLMPMRV